MPFFNDYYIDYNKEASVQDASIVREFIDELLASVRSNPISYFSESDLQSELFCRLLKRMKKKEEIKNIFVWGTDNPKKVIPIFSRRVHSELLLPDGRIDIAVLDLENVKFGINSKGKFGYVQLEPGQHIFIEIKASRTNRSEVTSRNQWIKLIANDFEKLKKYTHQCYLLCFDFNRLLDDVAVTSLTQKASRNVEVFYVRDNINNNYFVV